MRRTGLIAGLLMTACATAIAAAPRKDPPLTPLGWGELRIGMSEAEAVRRFGLVAQSTGSDCDVLDFPGRSDISGLARNGRLARIEIGGDSRLRTDRGVRIGSSEAAVRRAYGRRLEIERNEYEEAPAHLLTWWLRPRLRGVLFVTDQKGIVDAIYLGDETIHWLDGYD
jgi:hypothetical protein